MKRSTPTLADFDTLAAAAAKCRRCPAMEGRHRILSRANGAHDARIMLVGEAPGRLGAEQTGIPFTGDESGRRLDRLLAAAGWKRDQIFITNAVLCNPQNVQGNNRPPTIGELRNCSGWLESQIFVINPVLVVALGAVALQSLARIEQHDLDRPECWFRPNSVGRPLAGSRLSSRCKSRHSQAN